MYPTHVTWFVRLTSEIAWDHMRALNLGAEVPSAQIVDHKPPSCGSLSSFRMKDHSCTMSTIAVSSVTAQPASASTTCTAVTGLPLVANATCVKHDSDQDDGVIKNENTYVTSAAVDDVRRFYEGVFSQNAWTITEFKHDVEDNTWPYAITQAQQRLKIEIEPGQGANGAVTRITIAEK